MTLDQLEERYRAAIGRVTDDIRLYVRESDLGREFGFAFIFEDPRTGFRRRDSVVLYGDTSSGLVCQHHHVGMIKALPSTSADWTPDEFAVVCSIAEQHQLSSLLTHPNIKRVTEARKLLEIARSEGTAAAVLWKLQHGGAQ
jgi:hypothetical protein